MRFYTKPHQFYCGIDLHARTMEGFNQVVMFISRVLLYFPL